MGRVVKSVESAVVKCRLERGGAERLSAWVVVVDLARGCLLLFFHVVWAGREAAVQKSYDTQPL